MSPHGNGKNMKIGGSHYPILHRGWPQKGQPGQDAFAIQRKIDAIAAQIFRKICPSLKQKSTRPSA